MSSAAAAVYRQFRVPKESGLALIDPPLAQVRDGLHAIQPSTELAGLEFCGKSISVVRCEARREAVELARRYTSEYRDVPTAVSNPFKDSTPFILAGHQPELFHPGVWFKNFLLSNLAADRGAVAINFLVDNDLCRSTSIRVPSRTADGSVVATSVAFDGSQESVPWEHRGVARCLIAGASFLRKFANNCCQRLSSHWSTTFGSTHRSPSRERGESVTRLRKRGIESSPKWGSRLWKYRSVNSLAHARSRDLVFSC